MEALILFLLFAAVCAGFYFAEKHGPGGARLEKWFQEALQEFQSLRVSAIPDRLSFDGSSAEILKVEKICGNQRQRYERAYFTVAIYARSANGEYFMFRKTSTDKPFFKHIEKRIATNVMHLEKLTHTR